MKRLSIILPMYKVGPYVEKCIRSLEDQDLPQDEYEIICVNDGSPDNSRDIVLDLKNEYDNILIIDQENQGVSMARNKGIETANGEYILFIDPDDYVQKNTLESILEEVESKRAEMAITGYTFLDSNGNFLSRRVFDTQDTRIVSGIEAYYISRGVRGKVVDSSVGIFFKTKFLKQNSLSYQEGVILNQDVEFLARSHCLAEQCIFVNQMFYMAVTRIGSATKSNQFSTERIRKGFILAAISLINFQNKLPLTEEERKQFLNGPVIKFVLLAVYSAFSTRSRTKFLDTIKDLESKNLTKLNIDGCSKYNRVCGKSYNYSPYLAVVSMYIYQKLNRISRLF